MFIDIKSNKYRYQYNIILLEIIITNNINKY